MSKGTGRLWIRRVSFSGGFLDGLAIDLAPGLNCIIGGRGSGKTTALEAVRFALDRMPDPAKAKERYKQIDSLLEANLGAVRVELETPDGSRYVVERRRDEAPAVTDASGQRLTLNLARDPILGIDVHSQNEIESIAASSYLQLRLIDSGAATELRVVEDELEGVERELFTKAEQVCRSRRAVADLTQETRDMPEVLARLSELEVQGSDERAERLRHVQAQKTLRERLQRHLERVREVQESVLARLRAADEELRGELAPLLLEPPPDVPDQDLEERARAAGSAGLAGARRCLGAAMEELSRARDQVGKEAGELALRHEAQERVYEQALAACQADPGRARERARLALRKEQLEQRCKALVAEERALVEALERRKALRARLGDLRDRRLTLRSRSAARLDAALSPTIRVRVEPQGNAGEYAELLRAALKGSGMRGGTLADLVVERGVPPTELLRMVEADDPQALMRRLKIDGERASRILLLLREDRPACALETVELHDLPLIELQDGKTHKPAASLSTGQRCTAILPLLLLESERPLLVDQPEDNLDNSFVTTLVSSVRSVAERRQLLFVTHNPNLPVLGEAQQVVVLASSDGTASLLAQGDVDGTRRHIENVLEGGPEAFRLRMKRYGY